MSSETLAALEQAQVPTTPTAVVVPMVSPQTVRWVLLGSAAVVGLSLLVYLSSRRSQ